MIHQTYVTPADQRGGNVYLRFGSVDSAKSPDGKPALALGVELSSEIALQGIRTVLIMAPAEAIRLSDELRRLSFDITNKIRH